MHLTVIRSGSSGNCSLVEHESTRVLIDAGGQSQRGLAMLLDEAGVAPDTLDGIMITHLHRDHLNIATMRLAQRAGIPLWMHRKNLDRLPDLFRAPYRRDVTLHEFTTAAFTIGALQISAFGLSHDAVGTTSGFRLHPGGTTGGQELVYATDLGYVPPTVLAHLLDADTIFLEANHDPDLLWNNPRRPYVHKKRVTGKHGHLSNTQCAEAIIDAVARSRRHPTRIILGHLSGDHNSPQLALDTVGDQLHRASISLELVSSFRDRGTPRFAIGTPDTTTAAEAEPDQLSLF